MEHEEAGLRDGANPGAAGLAAARFLRELRQLRGTAGLGQAELAARAHYPRDVIETAESGPQLPDLPVLSAYVRGCGGTADDVAAWEDRWRSVTGAKAVPLLPARDAGNSDAASAGARIGATSAAADSHDPAAIMAALDRFAERMATASNSPTSAARSSGEPVGMTTALHGGSPRNGSSEPTGASSSRDPLAGGRANATPTRLSDSMPGMAAPSVPPGFPAPSGPATAGLAGPHGMPAENADPATDGTGGPSARRPAGAGRGHARAGRGGGKQPGRTRLVVAGLLLLCLLVAILVLFA